MTVNSHDAGLPFARRYPRWLAGLMLLVAVLAVLLHGYRLGGIPKGFYVDEASIAVNASQIALDGHDEHGVPWPLYFRAFGEYKNPVYIYFLSGIYAVAGLSETATRAASALCWLLGGGLLYRVCCRLTRDPVVRLYALVCIGFTPWLFSLSRISFEVISLLPLLALFLWAAHGAYEASSTRAAALAGVALGLSMYAYSTFRLLGPLHVAALLLVYAGRPYLRRHAVFLCGFGLTVLPLAFYALDHSDNLGGRFGALTYLNEPGWSLLDKVEAFGVRYVGYFSPGFLALEGDANRRHHTGYGGELLVATALLLVIGLVMSATRRSPRFTRVLAAGVLLSPVAAALTRDHGHSLRAFSMVVFAIPLSVHAATQLRWQSRSLAVALLAAAAGIQATMYVRDYFTRYPAVSITAFENYGFRQALRSAIDQSPGRVIVDEKQNQPFIDLRFQRSLLEQKSDPAIKDRTVLVGSKADLRPGDRFIVFDPSFACVGCREGLPPDGLYGVTADRSAAPADEGVDRR